MKFKSDAEREASQLAAGTERSTRGRRRWTFLSHHAHVLVCLSRRPGARIRDLAEHVKITERSVQRILADLEDEGWLIRRREGRRNRYSSQLGDEERHPLELQHDLVTLVDLLQAGAEEDA
ncbi:MAG: DNA-binding transcriptional ArsR family regulator [Planctomycetota bacterium]|jgi:DNA-binding transcriptional ArsR family regulator